MFILIPPSLSSFNPTHSFCKYLLILINFYFSQLIPSTYIIHIYSFLLITLSQLLSLSLRDFPPHHLHHSSPTHSLSYLTIIIDHPHLTLFSLFHLTINPFLCLPAPPTLIFNITIHHHHLHHPIILTSFSFHSSSSTLIIKSLLSPSLSSCSSSVYLSLLPLSSTPCSASHHR